MTSRLSCHKLDVFGLAECHMREYRRMCLAQSIPTKEKFYSQGQENTVVSSNNGVVKKIRCADASV